jgi:alpha-tubulin suppressor-like RCC1 family protein
MKKFLLLGKFNKNIYKEPTEIEFITKYKPKSFSCGSSHISFISEDDYLYVLGENKRGQCNKDFEKVFFVNEPKKIDVLLSKVVCGPDFSICISRDNNKVYTFGANDRGQVFLLLNY